MSDELVDQSGQPIDAAPELGEGGNVESTDVFEEAAKAMAQADAFVEAEKAAKEAALLGEDPPAGGPSQSESGAASSDTVEPAGQSPEETTEESKPDEPTTEDSEADESEPTENLSSGFHALRRKRKAVKEREAAVAAREERILQAEPILHLFDAFDSGESERALDVFAKLSGQSPNQAAMFLIDHLSAAGAEPKQQDKPVDREALKRELLAEVKQELSAHQVQSAAQRLVSEVMSVRTDPALAREHRALSAMPEPKLYQETIDSIEWARNNRPDLLRDPAAFRRLMAAAAQEELDSWNRAYGASGNGAPAEAKPEPAPAASATPKQPDALARTTITDDDTSTGGATRELSEEEALAKVAALFGG